MEHISESKFSDVKLSTVSPLQVSTLIPKVVSIDDWDSIYIGKKYFNQG